MYRNSFYLVLVLLLGAFGCKKPYTPQAIANPPSYLVVEGTILSGGDSTIFKLSRTVSLSSGTTTNPVTGANIDIEDSNSNRITLNEVQPGYYALILGQLDVLGKYRLRIILASGGTYLSDFVPMKTTPPIDSIGYTVQNGGMQLYVNTHDPNNNTRYYRWDYDEAWKFHAKFQSSYVTNGTDIVARNGNQDVYFCFAGDVSSTILLGSSAKLSKDVIYQGPLGFIPSTSEKIENRYSILLRQYALTQDAFTFWSNLKKNTEQLGSIFDAQPSQINGNIHNMNDPNEHVFGYVSACTVQQKRVFIDQSQLPSNWRTVYPYDCELDTLWYSQPLTMVNQVQEFLIPLGSNQIPVAYFGDQKILGYLATSRSCADCTIRGTTTQPSFWQ